MIASGFEKAAAVFNQLLQHPHQQRKSQLVVYHHGQKVVDLAGSASGTKPINEETPFLSFSVSKAFTAVAVWKLLEQGRLELDAPIGRYWPQFARRGKETATIRHALLHQAGVPAPHLNRQVLLWPFWKLVTADLARTRALFPPGSQTAYHMVNFGFILGEVVRRVTGMPIDRYLRETFFEPMGLKNTWMRMPFKEMHRSPYVFPASPTMRLTSFLFNLRTYRHALVPAAGLHSSANELAAFFRMLLDGGVWQGQRYLQPETINLAARSHFNGFDTAVGSNMSWGMGLIMGNVANDIDPFKKAMGYGSSGETFAAFGMGTCMLWADRSAGLVTAFTCDGMLDNAKANKRWARISNAVWSCA
jgi:CubicO group peptidase (beta-lactamase class C family)